MPRKRRRKQHVYHYDDEYGLLEEIVKVTSPPGKHKAIKRYEKRSVPVDVSGWKSVNHTYCVVCREGGELLCCDICPASFHLLCHEPIIRREAIPRGRWFCNRCRRATTNFIPGMGNRSSVATEEEYIKREISHVLTTKKINNVKDFYAALSASLTNCNAHQFVLPHPIRVDGLLPYSGLAQPRNIITDEPCTICDGVEEKSPKIRCDFCSYVYHIDCLRIPLCSPPSETWMCPNHVEPYVDSKLLSSISVTERRRLWANYARQIVNEHAIRREFIKKVVEDRKECKRCVTKSPMFSGRSGEPIGELCIETSNEQPTSLKLGNFPNCRVRCAKLSHHHRSSRSPKNEQYSSPYTFFSAVLPQSTHQRAVRADIWSHDRIYSIVLPAYSASNSKSEFRYIHVDFALGDDNLSLDCRSYSTPEDFYHRPVHGIGIPNGTSICSVAQMSHLSSREDYYQKNLSQQNSLEVTIPELKRSSNIENFSDGKGSVLRALLDSVEGLPSSVETVTTSKPLMMRRTRRSQKFLVKSTT